MLTDGNIAKVIHFPLGKGGSYIICFNPHLPLPVAVLSASAKQTII